LNNAYANLLYFASASIAGSVLMVEIGETENLLGVLMQGENYCDDGFIAEILNP